MSFGRILQSAREAKGLTRKQLAEKIGANVNSIVKYERAGEAHGNYPPPPVMAELVAVLKIDPRFLLAETLDDPEKKREMTEGITATIAGLLEVIDRMEDGVAHLNEELLWANRLIGKLIGSPDLIPDQMRGRFVGRAPDMFFHPDEPEAKSGPNQNDSDRSQSISETREAGETASNSREKGTSK